ncbi:BURP domain-containing protein precursor [Glycine max]|uniref:BURP domain-containing protein n=1 Tax=Glycine max TaxID=3847 RepID=B2ZPK6_SOYBN|nr:BURP domain-containing protein precursor [Glycine max]ACD49739.1 BURP domain-containing protein [Glycine max]|eukprot:NP_001238316.1 BURP domain-containing protein precursor [Glycine max]
MVFPLLSIFALLNLAVVATHAETLPPEVYWKSKLPTTPMPKAITDILHPDLAEDKSTSVAVGKGGVNVNAGKTKPGGTSVNVGKGGVNVNTGKGKPNKGTSVNVGKGGVNVNTGPKKGKPVHVGVGPHSPFDYNYAASETQWHDDPNVALFFLEKDLHYGTKLNLHFTRYFTSSVDASFLPRSVADSIPFSSNKVNEVLNKFSIKEGSDEAQTVKNTISECEVPGIKGEEKRCVTSLESMVDFATTKLGSKDVDAVSTEVTKKDNELQQYTMAPGVKRLGEDKASVVCHKENYPYAVFYCHKSENTKAYSVPLEGADGSRVKAVAVCHTDTSKWNPKHLAFQVLKVHPGTVPICHFLPQDHVVFVPK